MISASPSVRRLISYGVKARRDIERLARIEDIPGGDMLGGYCAIGSRYLAVMAEDLRPTFCLGTFSEYTRITDRYKMVSGHAWLELDGYIVDITASQFTHIHSKVARNFGQKVYVSRANNPHYKKTHSGAAALKMVAKWHEMSLDDLCIKVQALAAPQRKL